MEMKGNVRIYIRVSTEEQTLERQDYLIEDAKRQGYYIAGVYREKISGAVENRPELQRLIDELQQGDFVLAEKIDRISRLPLEAAEKLIDRIKAKGARLLIPGIVDFSDLINDSEGVSKIILSAVQNVLLKLSLQMARDDYELRRKRQKEGIELAKVKGRFKGRKPSEDLHKKIIDCRYKSKMSIAGTADLLGTSKSTVARVCRYYKNQNV